MKEQFWKNNLKAACVRLIPKIYEADPLESPVLGR